MSANTNDRRAAFVRGFWSGLASPANLFADAVSVKPVEVRVNTLHRSIVNPADAMRADWMQVGADIHAAIKKQKQAV